MITEQMTPAEEEKFNTLYASSFIMQTAVDYSIMLQVQFSEADDKYARNKAKDVEQACEKLIMCVQRHLTHGTSTEQQQILNNAVDSHKQLIYDLFSLDAPEQTRVRNLIAKIKKERGI